MGQTLTHGVYLPDEGERNCYSGLAANWQILDTSVGTIAEHTSALAGKAPLVHTHTKSDITDFPAYGNAAGTICEGNDSRLSDARTPIAHTHSKSDITNLFNSANTWTQTNYFTKDIVINSEIVTNTQSALSGNKIRQIVFNDSNNSNYFFRFRQYVDATSSRMQFNAQGFDSNNQAYSATFVYRVNSDGSSVLYPGDNNQSLGTANNKWKNLNGINPGALSLPDVFDSYDVITTNWNTGYDQPNNLQINGANPRYPGWLFIRLDNCTEADDFIIVRYYHFNAANITFYGTFLQQDSSYVLTVPIQAAIITKVWVSKLPTYCKYHACLGTVK